jgi:hypothetical protein
VGTQLREFFNTRCNCVVHQVQADLRMVTDCQGSGMSCRNYHCGNVKSENQTSKRVASIINTESVMAVERAEGGFMFGLDQTRA